VAVRKPFIQLCRESVIDRVSNRIALLAYSCVLRIGAEQLDALDCFGTECSGGDLSVERIGHLLQQGVSLTQNRAAGKVSLPVVPKALAATACVAQFHNEILAALLYACSPLIVTRHKISHIEEAA